MNDCPALSPVPFEYFNEINSRVIKRASSLPIYQMSPHGDRVCAKVAYGVATGAGDLMPFMSSDVESVEIEHHYQTFVRDESMNHTKIAIKRKEDSKHQDHNFEHKLTAYRTILLGNTFKGITNKSSYYVST
jgi:hypothetical protein